MQGSLVGTASSRSVTILLDLLKHLSSKLSLLHRWPLARSSVVSVLWQLKAEQVGMLVLYSVLPNGTSKQGGVRTFDAFRYDFASV